MTDPDSLWVGKRGASAYSTGGWGRSVLGFQVGMFATVSDLG